MKIIEKLEPIQELNVSLIFIIEEKIIMFTAKKIAETLLDGIKIKIIVEF